MRVLHVPVRLRFATAALFLSAPMAAVETILVTRAPWWRLPYRALEIWTCIVILIFFPITVWLLKGKRWSLIAVRAFSITWVALSAWVAIRTHNPTLGFFTVILMLFFLSLTRWLDREISRSFFDPQLRWYQRVPKPIAGLKCHVILGSNTLEMKVSRIDGEGAFLFTEKSESDPIWKAAQLRFSFRDRHIFCEGKPIRSLVRAVGAGFYFTQMSPDRKKELNDFIEVLRGEGYVA
jgi:hypothetical protein